MSGHAVLARPSRHRWTVAVVAVASAVIVLPLLWFLLGRVLKVDQGLDLTDEGFYLVAADPPNAQAAWLFPFGWHTRPLFALVGWDIAAFRTLGAVVLVVVAGLLSWLTARSVVGGQGAHAAWAFRILTTGTGVVGVLIFYTSMLRAPGYNWLGLVGIVACLIGVCWLILRSKDRGASWRSTLGPALVSSAGLFVTIPAKPSTAPFMVVSGLLALWLAVGRGPAIKWAVLALAAGPAWVALALAVRLWPMDFLAVLSLALQMPTPDPAQSLPGAIQAFLLVPRDALAEFAAVPDRTFLLLGVATVALLVPPLIRKRWWALRTTAQLSAGVVAIGVAGVPVPFVNPTATPLGLARPTTTVCLLIVLGAAALARWRLSEVERADAGEIRRVRLALVLILVFGAFAFAFGSDNGVFGQASMAGGLVLLSAAVATGGPGLDRTTVSTTIVVTVTATAIVGAGMIGGWRFPQRTAPLAAQVVDTPIGNHGGTLKLDQQVSATITSLAGQARGAGWTPETPLVDVSYTWHPGMAYALGGRVPQSLQLTIFGYGATHAITDFHLSAPYLDFPFDQAWLITSAPSTLDTSARSATDFTLEKLAQATGHPMPEAYGCLAAGDFILWKPTADLEGADTCGW